MAHKRIHAPASIQGQLYCKGYQVDPRCLVGNGCNPVDLLPAQPCPGSTREAA